MPPTVSTPPSVDLAPLLGVALIGAALALLPLLWMWWREREAPLAEHLRKLTLVTLMLSFDLVMFGAFTRLTDSGLGCPDWPGCYGSASPLGAVAHIQSAQELAPHGPVTHSKAWIEMIHRYFAAGVGALVLVLTGANWLEFWRSRRARGPEWTPVRGLRAPPSPWWATATLVWICAQGAFGALTVTMKLYPAIVTLHLLGGMLLLALLAAQSQAYARNALPLSRSLYAGALALAALTAVQIALGAWVSTNYAVLACADFPTCQGAWWPAMDFDHGFALLRELGQGSAGAPLSLEALTAIHMAHRLTAFVVLPACVLLAWQLHARGGAALRRWAIALVLIALWQLASGLGNVLLGWPLLVAVAHTAGAAALVIVLTLLIVRAHQARQRHPAFDTAPVPMQATS